MSYGKTWDASEDQFLVETHTALTRPQQAERLGRTVASIHARRAHLMRAGRISDAERHYNRPWTADDRAEIAALLAQGMSVPQVAKKLNRTISSVYSQQSIIEARTQVAATVRSANRAAALFGVAHDTFTEWIKRKWVRATRNRAGSIREGTKSRRPEYLITDDALIRFIERRETWPAWEPKWITDPDWRVFATEARSSVDGRWMTVKEVAARYQVATTTVLGWFARGIMADVATVVYYQRFFWSADIERFTPIDKRTMRRALEVHEAALWGEAEAKEKAG